MAAANRSRGTAFSDRYKVQDKQRLVIIAKNYVLLRLGAYSNNIITIHRFSQIPRFQYYILNTKNIYDEIIGFQIRASIQLWAKYFWNLDADFLKETRLLSSENW